MHPDPWRRVPPNYIGGITVRFPFLKSKTFWGVVGGAAVYLLKNGTGAGQIAEVIAGAMTLLGLRDAVAKNGTEGAAKAKGE